MALLTYTFLFHLLEKYDKLGYNGLELLVL
jgi:hypothetical protein